MALYKSLESFKFGNGGSPEVIGGSAPTHTTAVLDHYMFTTNEDDAEFVCRFVVQVTPSGNANTDYNALNAACQAVESALRKRYQRLEVDWGAGANAVLLLDPDTTNGALTTETMGFSAEPTLDKIKDWPNSGEARGYEFRVRIGRVPNYTDAYGAAAGRRQVDVNLHYDVDGRLVVTMTGSWTQVPSALARAQFLAQFPTGYAAYRLGLINSTDAGQSSDTWTITKSEASDPNDLSILRFTYEFSQHVNGRRISTIEIFYTESGQRIITIRGTYLRTITGSVFGVAAASSANFLDAGTGGYAYAVGTTLPGLVTAQGGPLTVGQNCELLREPYVTTNEEDDRTDYALIFRELIQQQSIAAGAFLDDPNIVNDSIELAVQFNEVNDSPGPPPAISTPAPGASGATTLGPQNQSAAPVVPAKPVDMFVNYSAFFVKSLTDCYSYFQDNVLPLLVETLTEEFNLTGVEFVSFKESTVRTDHRVGGMLHIRAYGASVIVFSCTIGLFNDLGLRVDPAFSGNPHEYLVQQALPRTTMSRRIEAVSKAGTFDINQYATKPAQQGWVLLTNALPATATKVLGIPALGVPQQPLTYSVLEENLIWVAKNVGQAGGGTTTGGGGGGGTPTPTGGGPSPGPAVATGVGGIPRR